MHASHCTDQVVGDILSGWRYDISGLSPAMRVDYEQHLHDCSHCRHRQTRSRLWDVLLLAVSTLSMVAFLLAAVVLRRFEAMSHISSLQVHLMQHTAITVSLKAVAISGLAISMILSILVAIATPIPGFLSSLWREHMPEDLRDRFTKHA